MFISTLLGGLITFAAILFTNALDLRKRKRAHEQLLHALLQGVGDEVSGLLEMAKTSPVRPIDTVPEGKPYEGLFTASQDYFIVYHANAALVMQIADGELRRSIIRTYTRAKAVLDTVNMNRLYLERYHYLQSTFLKTKDGAVQAECEEYRQALVQIAGQLKLADAAFRRTATGLLEMLPQAIGAKVKDTNGSGKTARQPPQRVGRHGASASEAHRSSMPAASSHEIVWTEPSDELPKGSLFPLEPNMMTT